MVEEPPPEFVSDPLPPIRLVNRDKRPCGSLHRRLCVQSGSADGHHCILGLDDKNEQPGTLRQRPKRVPEPTGRDHARVVGRQQQLCHRFSIAIVRFANPHEPTVSPYPRRRCRLKKSDNTAAHGDRRKRHSPGAVFGNDP
jgi:hypothetical protein